MSTRPDGGGTERVAAEGGIAAFTLYSCQTTAEFDGEELTYTVDRFNNTFDAIDLEPTVPFAARERNRILGVSPPQHRRLLKVNTNWWELGDEYTVELGLRSDGRPSIRVYDHMTGVEAGFDDGRCSISCMGPTLLGNERCLWNGVAEPDAFGDAVIQSIPTAAYGVLVNVVRWGRTAAAARAQAALREQIISESLARRDHCVHCALSHITGRAPSAIARETGRPLGPVQIGSIRGMLDDLGLSTTHAGYRSWDDFFRVHGAALPDDHLVMMIWPHEVGGGAHAVVLEAGGRWVDPQSLISGVQVIAQPVYPLGNTLKPVEAILTWRIIR